MPMQRDAHTLPAGRVPAQPSSRIRRRDPALPNVTRSDACDGQLRRCGAPGRSARKRPRFVMLLEHFTRPFGVEYLVVREPFSDLSDIAHLEGPQRPSATAQTVDRRNQGPGSCDFRCNPFGIDTQVFPPAGRRGMPVMPGPNSALSGSDTSTVTSHSVSSRIERLFLFDDPTRSARSSTIRIFACT